MLPSWSIENGNLGPFSLSVREYRAPGSFHCTYKAHSEWSGETYQDQENWKGRNTSLVLNSKFPKILFVCLWFSITTSYSTKISLFFFFFFFFYQIIVLKKIIQEYLSSLKKFLVNPLMGLWVVLLEV